MSSEELSDVKKLSKAAALHLKQERERHGWSQTELADRLGTTQVNISRWETGITFPGPFFRRKLAEALGKSIEELGLVQEIASPIYGEASSEAPITPESAPTIQNIQRWNIPYHRNPFFTGREEILLHLYTVLNTDNTAALTQAQAISGLGGIGKTQIAVEYAYRYREHYSAVLWVSASSRDAFISDFVMLAAFLDLPEKSEHDQEIVISAVKRWLSSNTNWLLIIDNVDDLQIIVEFLPTLSTGKVLITTRLQALGPVARGIEVEKMWMDEGELFWLRRIGTLTQVQLLAEASKEAQSQAADIITELDALPLALDQAGAYIEETQCGLSAYLTLYRARRKELLHRRGNLPTDHPEPVAATWSLSFQQVQERLPAAADLLRLLAFLGPDVIPEEILTCGASELGPELSSIASDPLLMDEIIRLLLGYSLIRRNAEERSLSIHRLVQAVLKDSMSDATACDWSERAIRAINRVFPESQPDTWKQCARCLPHVLAIISHLDVYGLIFPEAADLLNKAAAYLTDHAQYTLAEQLLEKALAVRKRSQDSQHPALALTLNELGALYLTRGRYPDAEPLLRQALEIRRQQLGLEHPDTATTLNNLARLYHAQGKYDEAETLYQHVYQIRTHTLQSNHPDIARSLDHLAELYTDKGKYAEAESLHQQALEIKQQVLGPDDPEVAYTLNSLALVYRKQGQYIKAEHLYRKALSMQQHTLGLEHPDVASTLNNLARLLRAQGAYAKAEPVYREALTIREKVFGSDHPLVAQSQYNLMKLYHSQGRYQEAELLGKQALSIQERALGNNHPDIAYTLDTLARLYLTGQRYAEIEQLYKRALHIRETAFGENHPSVALTLSSLSEVYLSQGKYLEARPLIEKSLKIRELMLGEEHPYIAYNLSNLAETYRLEGSFVKAEQLYKQALAIREKTLGPDHPHTATTYHELASLYFIKQHYDLAESLFLKALALREKALAPGHPNLIDTLEYLARVYRETDRRVLADEYETKVQALRAKGTA